MSLREIVVRRFDRMRFVVWRRAVPSPTKVSVQTAAVALGISMFTICNCLNRDRD